MGRINILKLCRSSSVLLILPLIAFFAGTEARQVNLTRLDNCEEYGQTAPVHLTSVRYDINPDTGVCDVIHGEFSVKTIDTAPKVLFMTLFKCAPDSTGKCLANPTTHEEAMDCKRFVEDDAGPWHMFSSSMSGSKCGEEMGEFTLDYSRLKVEHLINYLDIQDDQYSRFMLKMNFMSTTTQESRGCGEVEFNLVKPQ